MTYNYQTRGQGFLSGAVLSRRATAGGGALLGDAKPPALDICEGVDCLGTYVIEFYTERIAFTRICLPYVGIIMVCIRVYLVELPFQTVMGWIPVLEYPWFVTSVSMDRWSAVCIVHRHCIFSFGIDRHHLLRPRCENTITVFIYVRLPPSLGVVEPPAFYCHRRSTEPLLTAAPLSPPPPVR
jgi:hypothetical protein